MFNQSQRMNSREFTRVYNTGKKYFSSIFRIVIGGSDFKVAVVIPKKKIKKRVQRNREKRRIIHIVKEIYNKQYPTTGIIIFLQKDTSELESEDLHRELEQLLGKTGI